MHDTERESAEQQGLAESQIQDFLAPLGLKSVLLIGISPKGDGFSFFEGTMQDFIMLMMIIVRENPEMMSLFLATLVSMASTSVEQVIQGQRSDQKGADQKNVSSAKKPAVWAGAKNLDRDKEGYNLNDPKHKQE